jgi:ribA/ribD-fused uncharacterized protein
MRWIADDGTVYENVIHFQKATDDYGDLGNMTGGFLLRVNGIAARTPEALYQAMRFPHEPTWQREIIDQNSPMMCKRLAHKAGRKEKTRPDWEEVSIAIMRWVLRVKLCLHFERFSALLRGTADRGLVERSAKDKFWGAVETAADTLEGNNQLGRLWMDLRQELRTQPAEVFLSVPPLDIPDFLLYGQAIRLVKRN